MLGIESRLLNNALPLRELPFQRRPEATNRNHLGGHDKESMVFITKATANLSHKSVLRQP